METTEIKIRPKATLRKLPLVMMIDDSEADLCISNYVIRKNNIGNDILNFRSGRAALEYLHKNAAVPGHIPDIILLDISMPEMDGFEFMVEYEHLPLDVKTKCNVYMVSSSKNTEHKKRVSKLQHVKDFFQKPLSREDILEFYKAKLSYNYLHHPG